MQSEEEQCRLLLQGIAKNTWYDYFDYKRLTQEENKRKRKTWC